MSKFKVGEVVIYLHDGKGFTKACDSEAARVNGSECTVTDGPWTSDTGATAYDITFPCGARAYARETSLRKRRPPEQPADDQEFIDWFNKVIKQDTIESTMRHVARNPEQFAGRGK